MNEEDADETLRFGPDYIIQFNVAAVKCLNAPSGLTASMAIFDSLPEFGLYE